MPPEPPEPAPGHAGLDPELEAALKQVLRVVYQDHPLKANQILVLAAELQRLGVHRLVEEHISRLHLQAGRAL